MAIYPRGDRFMVSVGAGPTRVRKTFKTEEAARAWETSEEARREASKALPEPSAAPTRRNTCWTLQQSFDHTLLHRWKGTGGEYKAVLNAQQALDFFGPNTPVDGIVATEVVRFMSHLIANGNSPATRNKKMSALRVMLDSATDYGNLSALPKMKRVKEKRQEPAWFRTETEAAMLTACINLEYLDLHDFIIVGIDTGFRSCELLALTRKEYVQNAFVLVEGFTKNGAPRRVPATARVQAIVAAREASGEPAGAWRMFPTLTKSVLRGQWEDLRSHMGLDDDPMFTPHKLRHTCATRLVSAGVQLKVVQEWMGHEVIETTMRYAHLANDATDLALIKLETLKAIKP